LQLLPEAEEGVFSGLVKEFTGASQSQHPTDGHKGSQQGYGRVYSRVQDSNQDQEAEDSAALGVKIVVTAGVQNALDLLAGYPSQAQIIEAREHLSSIMRASANTVNNPGHGASTWWLVEDDTLSKWSDGDTDDSEAGEDGEDNKQKSYPTPTFSQFETSSLEA